MSKRGKNYKTAAKKVASTVKDGPVTLLEACKTLKDISKTKFDATVDLSVNLGIDPTQADQALRGSVPLPHGLGKTVRVVVFAKGEKVAEATEAGADHVGGDDLAAKIQEGWLDFDCVVAAPDMMGVVGKLGKILGPRSLMPNPKLGTVTFDVAKSVEELKAGRAQYRAEKAGIIHAAIGKVSFDSEKLSENASALLESLLKAKPSSVKGTYLKKITISSTMSPGVSVDPAPFRH